LITIFILIGIGFLCGGVAAIVDGMPYMVLERGFTQVIIGTVVAVAGVVMLALSWVLFEVRRLKKTLSGAAMAMSVASMVGSPAAGYDGATPRMTSGSEDAAGTPQPGLAAAGALAGAGGALAAAQALAAPVPGEPENKAVEPDLFGAHLEQGMPPAADADAPDGHRLADVDALPDFDPFRPVDPQGVPEPEAPFDVPAVHADALGSEPPAAPPEGQGATPETTPADALPEPAVAGPSDIDDPLAPDLAPAPSREIDEFGMLRESLAGLGIGSGPSGGRIEPSFADVYSLHEPADGQAVSNPDELTVAARWMGPALPRRAPWLGDAGETSQEALVPPDPDVLPELEVLPESEVLPEPSWPALDVAERDVRPWPPQTRDAAVFEQPAPETAVPEEAPASDTAVPDESAPEPVTSEADAAGEAPAASEEGIVGAYQVGEAHFTIYADGSIQARTPDGDYSFASMDELKIYLASEKSRLGV
jgi:hypothetical protein